MTADQGGLSMVNVKAIVIETARHVTGRATGRSRRSRGFASDALFYPLDNQTFSGLRDLWAAIDRLAPRRDRGEGSSDE
jgi:hypothetical protein